jgi:hypothetical protein
LGKLITGFEQVQTDPEQTIFDPYAHSLADEQVAEYEDFFSKEQQLIE